MLASEFQQLHPGLWMANVESEASSLHQLDGDRFRSLIQLSVSSALGFRDHSVHTETFTKIRSPQQQRQPFAGDHFWHHDLMREGEALHYVLTCLLYVKAGDNSPGTQFIDTVGLHKYLMSTGFYENLGYKEADLASLHGRYSEAYYRDTALAQFNELTRGQYAKEIDEHRANTALVDEHTVSRMPFLAKFSDGDAVVFDHERCEGLYDEEGQRHDQLLSFLRLATANEALPTLSAAGVLYEIKPERGMIAIFQRLRALHRSLPGNTTERIIRLGWASKQLQKIVL